MYINRKLVLFIARQRIHKIGVL